MAKGMPGKPPPLPGIDLNIGTVDSAVGGDSPELSELSINDEDAPIRAYNAISNYDALIEEDKDKKSDHKEDENLTEFEAWQKEEQDKYFKKRRKTI